MSFLDAISGFFNTLIEAFTSTIGMIITIIVIFLIFMVIIVSITSNKSDTVIITDNRNELTPEERKKIAEEEKAKEEAEAKV